MAKASGLSSAEASGSSSAEDFDTSVTVACAGVSWEFTGGILGRGAFGVVLDARCTSRDERAAVKIVDTRPMSAWQARQSESERALWSTLQHPCILVVFPCVLGPAARIDARVGQVRPRRGPDADAAASRSHDIHSLPTAHALPVYQVCFTGDECGTPSLYLRDTHTHRDTDTHTSPAHNYGPCLMLWY